MSAYNLTVQLNLQGPRNLNSVVNNINQRLSNIQATVNVQTSPQTAQALQNIANNSRAVQQNAAAAANSMERFGQSAGLAIKRFAAFTAATAGFYAVTRATTQSIERFIEYDKQLTRIAQVTGTTKAGLDGLSNTITNLSTSLGTSSASLAQVAVTLSQAGLSAKQTEQALKALALTTLAPTFNDINQTVEGSIALMKQFSISTTQLEKALGSINAVAGQFAVEASDIIAAIQRTGGVFAAASNGVSEGTDALNEFIAVFTSVRATTRESAETIATGLRTIFSRIQRQDTIEALKAFGVELTDLEGKFVGPYAAIQRLAEGLRSLDPRDLQFSSIVEELGGFRQVGKVIPLIQQFTTAQQALNVAQRGSGSLAQDAATGQQALAVQISKVQQEFDAFIRSIGQTKEFQQFIRLSLDLASALIKVADSVKPLVPALAALGAAGFARGIPSIARGFRRGVGGGGGTGFASGGLVPGSGNSDSVRAMLTPGEYVIRKKAVQAIGADRLASMNKYASGGSVKSLLGVKRSLESKYDTQNIEDLYSFIKVDRKAVNKLESSRQQYRDKAEGIWSKAASIYSSKNSLSGANRYIRRKVGINLPNRLGPKELDPSNKDPQRLNKIQGSLAEKQVYNNNGNLRQLPTLAGADFSVGGSSIQFAEVKNRLQVVSDDDLRAKALLGHQYLSNKQYKNEKIDKVPRLTISLFSSNTDDYKRGKKYAIGGNVKETPALLTPGEFVINKKAASSIGQNTLNRLNNADRLPKYHSGGAVGNINLLPRYNTGGNVTDSRGLGIANTIGLAFALQGAASMFATSIEDASSEGAARMGGSIQGAISGLNTGLIGAQIGGMIPVIGPFVSGLSLASAGALAIANSFMEAENASIDFANKMSKQNISQSADKITRSLEELNKNVNDFRSIRDTISGIRDATQATREQRTRETQSTRLSYGNLVERFAGAGPLTQAQMAAGTTGDQITAQRSLVLAVKGFSEYARTFVSNTGGNAQVAQDNLANAIRDINRVRAADSSREFASIADSATKLIEQRLRQGVNLEDIINNQEFKALYESLARANPEIERAILNIEADTSISKEERDAKIQNIIAIRGEAEVRDRTAAVRKQIEIENAKSAGRAIETVLTRIFTNFEQTFNAVATKIEQDFGKINLNINALSGKASVGLGEDFSKSVLENPLAYGSGTVNNVIKSIKPLLGSQSDLISNLAIGSTELEGRIISSINTAIQENPDANPEEIAGKVRSSVIDIVRELNLPSDIANTLVQQIKGGIEELITKGKDKVSLDSSDVRENIDGFAGTIDSLNGAMKTVIAAQSLYRGALEKYTSLSNNIIELLTAKNEYLQRSFDVLANSAIQLDQAFGRILTASDVRRQETQSLEMQTGGISDPRQLFNAILDLDVRRQGLQARLSETQDPGSFDQFRQLNNQLISTNVELNTMQQALKTVAESSRVADAALADIARQQEKRQQQAGFLEQLVTSTPEQMMSLNQAYADLQRSLAGQSNTIYTSIEAQKAYIETLRSTRNPYEAQRAAQGVLAQERGNVLSLVKEIAPFLGSSREANNMRADVLGAQLNQLGLMTPQFATILQSIRNPQADPQVQESIRIFRDVSAKQATANSFLSKLSGHAAQIAQQSGAQAIANAIANVQLTLSAQSARDIASAVQPPAVAPVAKASGGIIYAAQGQQVEMRSRGTDTVPAMLTPGEFVVNKKATSKNRGLLESINSGKTRYYRYGGYVSGAFDESQSRSEITSNKFAPIEQWENWRNSFDSRRKSNIVTAQNFVNLNEAAVDLDIQSQKLPQEVNGQTIQTPEQLSNSIYRHFAGNSLVPGNISDVIIENRGKYDPNLQENDVNYGTASRIAKAAYGLVKEGQLSEAQAAYAFAIPQRVHPLLAERSGVSLNNLQEYVMANANQTASLISIYTKAFKSKAGDLNWIDPINAGLYGLSAVVPATDPNLRIDSTNIKDYAKQFNSLTMGLQDPADLDIKDGVPTGRSGTSGGNISWNAKNTDKYGIYQYISADPFGVQVNPQTYGFFGSGYRIEATGNQGKRYNLNNLGKYSEIKNSSSNIFELIKGHREALKGGLEESPDVVNFINALDRLYSEQQPWESLTGSARFFKDKTAPITGLNETTNKLYIEKLNNLNDKKNVYPDPWDIAYQGRRKRLGLLRTKDTSILDSIKDKAVKEMQKKEQRHYQITEKAQNTRNLIIPFPNPNGRGNQLKRIKVPIPYKLYSGDLYDDNAKVFRGTIRDKIVPDYLDYDSFLKGKSTDDLLYDNIGSYEARVLRSLANQQRGIVNYIIRGTRFDPSLVLNGATRVGSSKPKIYSTLFPRNRSKSINIAKEIIPALDAFKAQEMGRDAEPFIAPADRTAQQGISSQIFNNALKDSVGFWGGIRGPLAATLRAQRIGATNDDQQAIANASAVGSMFDREVERGPEYPLTYKSWAFGYGQLFKKIGSGVLDAFAFGRGGFNTRLAAFSFGQDYWMDNYVGNMPMPQNANFVNDAINDVANNPATPQSFSELWGLFLDPYKKYNSRTTRSVGIQEIFQRMVNASYYQRRRVGFIPSAQEASVFYGNLRGWYAGDAEWMGQDAISEEMNGIQDPQDKLDTFNQYRLFPARYNISNMSHMMIGAGKFGRLPNLDEIRQINNVPNLPVLGRAGGGIIPAQGFSEGGVALLDRALQEQKEINIRFGNTSSTEIESGSGMVRPTMVGADIPKPTVNVGEDGPSPIMVPQTGQQEPVRRFFNRKGSAGLVGRLVSVSNGVATLERPNGTTIKVPIRNLSEHDSRYVSMAQRNFVNSTQAKPTPEIMSASATTGMGLPDTALKDMPDPMVSQPPLPKPVTTVQLPSVGLSGDQSPLMSLLSPDQFNPLPVVRPEVSKPAPTLVNRNDLLPSKPNIVETAYDAFTPRGIQPAGYPLGDTSLLNPVIATSAPGQAISPELLSAVERGGGVDRVETELARRYGQDSGPSAPGVIVLRDGTRINNLGEPDMGMFAEIGTSIIAPPVGAAIGLTYAAGSIGNIASGEGTLSDYLTLAGLPGGILAGTANSAGRIGRPANTRAGTNAFNTPITRRGISDSLTKLDEAVGLGPTARKQAAAMKARQTQAERTAATLRAQNETAARAARTARMSEAATRTRIEQPMNAWVAEYLEQLNATDPIPQVKPVVQAPSATTAVSSASDRVATVANTMDFTRVNTGRWQAQALDAVVSDMPPGGLFGADVVRPPVQVRASVSITDPNAGGVSVGVTAGNGMPQPRLPTQVGRYRFVDDTINNPNFSSVDDVTQANSIERVSGSTYGEESANVSAAEAWRLAQEYLNRRTASRTQSSATRPSQTQQTTSSATRPSQTQQTTSSATRPSQTQQTTAGQRQLAQQLQTPGTQEFWFEAIDAATGRDVRGDAIFATNPADAQRQVRAMGYMVTNFGTGKLPRSGIWRYLTGSTQAYYANGGLVQPKYLATGGKLANYAPRGTDTVPAMLTPGEFVVNRDSAQKNLPLLKAINRSKGGSVNPKYLAMGGVATSPWPFIGVGKSFQRTGPFTWPLVTIDPYLRRWDEHGMFQYTAPGDAAKDRFYGKQKEGKNDYATRVGFGYDAVGRPVLNNAWDIYASNAAAIETYAYLAGIPGGIGAYQPGYRQSSSGQQPGFSGGSGYRRIPGLYQKGGSVRPKYLASGGVATSKWPWIGKERTGPITWPEPNINPYDKKYDEYGRYQYTSVGDSFKDRYYGQMRALELSGLTPGSPEYEQYRVAISKGFGLDPVGRPVFNNPFSIYGDYRGNAQDLITVFDAIVAAGGYVDPNYKKDLSKIIYGASSPSGAYGIPGVYQRGGSVKPKYLAAGGKMVDFSPRGTDTVPAMLTPGEFVVNRKATQQNLGLLKAINKSTGGVIRNGTLYASDGAIAGGTSASVGSGGGSITVNVETPKIDFSEFTAGITTFGGIVTPLSTAIQTLAGVDFGVINTGAQSLSKSSQTLGTNLSRLDSAVNNFSNKTNSFINAINSLKLDGTINVQGSIAMQPLTVNIAGLESIETRIKGMGSLITTTIATALAEDNPGMSTSALRASASLYNS